MKSRGKMIFRIMLAMMIILLLTVMVSTAPSFEQFESWTLQKHDITCDKKYKHWCVKDNEKLVSRSGMFGPRIIFNIYNRTYEYEDGRIISFNVVGIFGNYYELKDGKLWEILTLNF